MLIEKRKAEIAAYRANMREAVAWYKAKMNLDEFDSMELENIEREREEWNALSEQVE